MKRYALFCGLCYYAEGGWRDFRGTFDTTDDCLAAYIAWATKADVMDEQTDYNRWAHVVDLQHVDGPVPVLEHHGSDPLNWTPYHAYEEWDNE